jgi:hypothetical protein
MCSVIRIVSPYVYYCSLHSVYKCKDHCHREGGGGGGQFDVINFMVGFFF